MAVAAARRLRDGAVCFVGIGLPSRAANLARATHAPACVLIYESGTIGAKPLNLPLSIGDGELAETADAVVGRARDLQLLAAGRAHRRGLPGGGPDRPLRQPQQHRDRPLRPSQGAPAGRRRRARDRRLMQGDAGDPQAVAADVRRPLDFRTSVGFGDGPGSREAARVHGRRRQRGHHRPGRARARSQTCELTLTRVHPGVERRAGGGGDRLAAAGRRRPRHRPRLPTTASWRRCARCARSRRRRPRDERWTIQRVADGADGTVHPPYCTPTTARRGCARRSAA